MSFASQATGAIVAVVVGIGAILPATQRQPPISIDDIAVVTPVVMPGDDLLLRITVTRERVCNTTSYVTLFDGGNIEYRKAPDERPAFGPAGEETRIVRHMVPAGALPGPARYRLVLEFQCDFNWTHKLWPVVLQLPDIPFQIGEPDG